MLTSIDARRFCQMMVCGANTLKQHKQIVDEMNVFPVPDGDTGTNMSMTVVSAATEVRNLYLSNEMSTIPQLAKVLSSGALRGARGNSGVITSQLFRGMYKGLKNVDEIHTATLAEAMTRGVETAYKAVMKPKEGTILTVAREMAQEAVTCAMETDDVEELLRRVIEHGKDVLQQTPEMLSVLKEAGVVDAGGQGLIYVYSGMLEGLSLEYDQIPEIDTGDHQEQPEEESAAKEAPEETLRYGYRVSFVAGDIKEPSVQEAPLSEFLNTLSEVDRLVFGETSILVDVRTNDPGLVLQKGISIGAVSNIVIQNLSRKDLTAEEVENLKPRESEPVFTEPMKDLGFITVSVGDGLSLLFQELGVDYVIPGGQTMNPSTDDMLKAIKHVNAANIVILPNNKNIILAAEQAAQLTTDRKIYVVESRSIPQGITAMLNLGISDNLEENIDAMRQSLDTVSTGQVTFAVRDTHVNGMEIHKHDILALLDDEVCTVGTDQYETTAHLIDTMAENSPELITIYTGADADPALTDRLLDYVRQILPEAEVESHEGGQPLYYYIISAE